MKRLILFSFLIPLLAATQTETTFNADGEIISINQEGINDLVAKYKESLKSKGGVEGWRLQIKFKSKREDILPYKIRFIKKYPEIPAQITFDSPYYKLTAGNFRTKNEALKIKARIKKKFPGAFPFSIILEPSLLNK